MCTWVFVETLIRRRAAYGKYRQTNMRRLQVLQNNDSIEHNECQIIGYHVLFEVEKFFMCDATQNSNVIVIIV